MYQIMVHWLLVEKSMQARKCKRCGGQWAVWREYKTLHRSNGDKFHMGFTHGTLSCPSCRGNGIVTSFEIDDGVLVVSSEREENGS